jgi:hypothetical protein
MSVEAENRSTIEALWRAWNEERLDEVIAMYAHTHVFVTSPTAST